MRDQNREAEIITQIKAFTNGTCSKSEYLPELLKLQSEVVELVMGEKKNEKEKPRLWHVESFLREQNAKRENIADEELDYFSKKNKSLINDIKSEFSGKRGEDKVFHELEELQYSNSVLRNIEFEFDGKRVEIDAIVFTSRAAFIIEIKNSLKNIYIDKHGEFIREGVRRSSSDGNILLKMNMREAFLRRALEWTGMENIKIHKIVVFTNTKIEIANDCFNEITTMYSSQLSKFIDSYNSKEWYTPEAICSMTAAVNELKCQEAYKMSVDMDDYKYALANLMVKLQSEAIPEVTSETINEVISIDIRPDQLQTNNKCKSMIHKIVRYSANAAVVVASLFIINAATLTGARSIQK
ncbi:MAG: NERD domain-containing protein [Crenarchaeota archaeon]|nr:NERD domain-containing protein [Thermoproteota archaeon]